MSTISINNTIKRSLLELNRRYKHSNRFVLGVSGGPDSQCLLRSFAWIAGAKNCLAVGINHGFRKEADEELNLAENLANQCGVSFERKYLHLTATKNIQAIAREARYQSLQESADQFDASFIVTAHHFDDKAETVMIRLLRGDKLGSLNILPLVSGKIFRPMLQLQKKHIMEYVARNHINFASDPSNQNTKYLRVKIRKEIFPMLESINPQIKKRLVNLCDEIHDICESDDYYCALNAEKS